MTTMRFNRRSWSPLDRKNHLRWKENDSVNLAFLLLVEHIGSRLETMLPRQEKNITEECFVVTLRRIAPNADKETVAKIVRELLRVWTFASILPTTVKEMQYHGILPLVFSTAVSLNSYVIEHYVEAM